MRSYSQSWLLAGLVLVSVSVGCGDVFEEFTVSCDTSADDSKCSESQATEATEEVDRDLCENPVIGDPGTFSTSGCSSNDRVGVCDQTDADNDIHYYSNGGNPYDATTAEAACDGTFTAD